MPPLPSQLSPFEQSRLWTAQGRGDLATVRAILEPLVAEPCTDICQGRRITALHLAARCGMEDLVDRLIDAGAEVDKSSIGGMGDFTHETPLHFACEGGHAKVVARLIAEGATINAVRSMCRVRGKVQSGLAIAAEAGHGAVVEALLRAGADPNGEPSEEWDPDDISLMRPLPVAIAKGHPSIASMLLGAGASLDLESAFVGPRGEHASARRLIMQSSDRDIRALI